MVWTLFWDMHSGGSLKLEFSKCYIEANELEAVSIFEDTFGRNPFHVTCDCCGEDYSVMQYDTLEEATRYLRQDELLEEYIKSSDVKLIYTSKGLDDV